MSTDWDIIETGPTNAEHTVLLLPGGMCNARSWAEVMAEPSLADHHLVAVTLPGQAGTPGPGDDWSNEHYAELTAELAAEIDADVVVGFSMGAVVAYEMAVAGSFTGPLVLLGLTLSAPDEPAFFRALIRLGHVFGNLPTALMRRGVASMAGKIAVPRERRAELKADFLRNRPQDMRLALNAYLRWLHKDEDRARRLVDAHLPTWVLHAEKGDGRLTEYERGVLDKADHVETTVLPGSVFFLPNEVPDVVAGLINKAIAKVRTT